MVTSICLLPRLWDGNRSRQISVCVCLQMKDLVAKVSATADADVCIDGTGSATAQVESHCLQAIYANVWAKVRLRTRCMYISPHGMCVARATKAACHSRSRLASPR